MADEILILGGSGELSHLGIANLWCLTICLILDSKNSYCYCVSVIGYIIFCHVIYLFNLNNANKTATTKPNTICNTYSRLRSLHTERKFASQIFHFI